MLENRMLVDSEWIYVEPATVEPVKGEWGYLHIWRGEFIPDCEALDYAREHAEQGNMTDEEFLEWYFSDNWVRKCRCIYG